MGKIDERTVVPIGWVAGGFVFLIGISITGAFWVSAVNFRLSRIEERLGIPPYQAGIVTPIQDANANPTGGPRHVNPK